MTYPAPQNTPQTPAVRGEGSLQQAERFIRPRASVHEQDDKVLLTLEMPGVDRDNVEITVDKDELTVTGWRPVEDYQAYEVVHRERVQHPYRRTFILGDRIDGSAIAAAMSDGVLTLTLPKSEGAKPRRIEVQ